MIRLGAILFASVTLAISCDCVTANIQQAKKGADIIFRGRIVAFRNAESGERMAVFSVDRVWKGDVGSSIEMAALEKVDCVSFPRKAHLELGNELLVYARRIVPLGGYFTDECSRTALAGQTQDFHYLGRGHKPNSK